MTTMNGKSRANIALDSVTAVCKMSCYPPVLPSCPHQARRRRQGDVCTDKEIVEKVIRNTNPLRGRLGTNLAGVLLYVIGIAYACPVSSDTVVRSDWGLSVATRHPAALGYEPGCSSLEVTGALKAFLESDADVASQKFRDFLRELGPKVRPERLALAAFPAEAAEERVRDDMIITSLQSLKKTHAG
eukprot:1857408-Pyramimonas_sp.AAC.1